MICPLNIYPNDQFSAYTSKRPLARAHPSVCLNTSEKDRRGKNIEILDKNRKQQHVMSICTISVLASDFLTLPGWLCVRLPSPSIYLCLGVPSQQRERQKTGTHTLYEKLCQEEKKWGKCRRNKKS